MKIFWWQCGLHLEPQTDGDRAALMQLEETLRSFLNLHDPGHRRLGIPSVKLDDEQGVVAVDFLTEERA